MKLNKKLKSIPLKFLIQEWLKIRNLTLFEEHQFSHNTKKYLKELKLIHKQGGFFFGDLNDYKIFLVCIQKNFSNGNYNLNENLLQDYLLELKDFLFHCGRTENDFTLIKIPLYSFEFEDNSQFVPIFFIVSKPEKPFFETLLGGEEKKNFDILNHKKIIKNAIDTFYENYSHEKDQKIPNLFIKKIHKNNESKKIYKIYLKKFPDEKKYVLLILGIPIENYDINYLKNLIEFYVYAERPVLKLEESIKNQNLNPNISIILLEIRFDFFWRGIFFKSNTVFVSNKKQKIYYLPEITQKKRYIKMANSCEEDYWILLPEVLDLNKISKESFLKLELKKILQEFPINTLFLVSFKNLENTNTSYNYENYLNARPKP